MLSKTWRNLCTNPNAESRVNTVLYKTCDSEQNAIYTNNVFTEAGLGFLKHFARTLLK